MSRPSRSADARIVSTSVWRIARRSSGPRMNVLSGTATAPMRVDGQQRDREVGALGEEHADRRALGDSRRAAAVGQPARLLLGFREREPPVRHDDELVRGERARGVAHEVRHRRRILERLQLHRRRVRDRRIGPERKVSRQPEAREPNHGCDRSARRPRRDTAAGRALRARRRRQGPRRDRDAVRRRRRQRPLRHGPGRREALLRPVTAQLPLLDAPRRQPRDRLRRRRPRARRRVLPGPAPRARTGALVRHGAGVLRHVRARRRRLALPPPPGALLVPPGVRASRARHRTRRRDADGVRTAARRGACPTRSRRSTSSGREPPLRPRTS